jgi:triacylglycerol lipase
MKILRRIISIILLTLAMNSPVIAVVSGLPPWAYVLLFLLSFILLLLVNIFPTRVTGDVIRLRSIRKGHELILLFSASFLLCAASNIAFGLTFVPEHIAWWQLAVNIAVCLICLFILLMNGLSRVFLTSLQLGIKWRVLIILFWWVPGVNIWLLRKVCRLIRSEYEFESNKNELNKTRKENELCRTRYPLLMVHGVFFRDFRYFNYWGRIPKELKKNGADIYLGEQQSAASVKDSADEIAEKIRRIISETGCGKVNIIAHSKGGLDARYAISRLGMEKYVASLTTVNTPHRGCVFADRLLDKAPDKLKHGIARRYNATLKKLGDKNPDFLAAVTDLTASSCRQFNEEAPDREGVYYQSVASKMNAWTSGKFPLNLSHLLVKPYDGDNDGLVSVESARWGESFRFLTVQGKRGISHGDVIDLNRENIDGFDIRELYVDIVRNLKAMSL